MKKKKLIAWLLSASMLIQPVCYQVDTWAANGTEIPMHTEVSEPNDEMPDLDEDTDGNLTEEDLTGDDIGSDGENAAEGEMEPEVNSTEGDIDPEDENTVEGDMHPENEEQSGEETDQKDEDLSEKDDQTNTKNQEAKDVSLTLNEEQVPDEHFCAYLAETIDTDQNGILDREEADSVTALDVSGREITDLTGVEFFTNLEELNCENNRLEVLELEGLTNLRKLNCSWNRLAALDLQHVGTLEELDCEANAAVVYVSEGKVDWEQLPGFSYEDVMQWREIEADADGRIALAEGQDLPEDLTYSYDTNAMALADAVVEFTIVPVELQQETTEELTKAKKQYADTVLGEDVEDFEEIKAKQPESFHKPESENTEEIQKETGETKEDTLRKEEASKSTGETQEQSWWEMYRTYLPEGEMLLIDENSFPDEAFREEVLQQADSNGDSMLSQREREQMTTWKLSGKEIYHLQGIEYFTNLRFLDCSHNFLQELDSDDYVSMLYLDCSANQLKVLDASSWTKLRWLKCNENQLMGLDLENLSSLEILECQDNQRIIKVEEPNQVNLKQLEGLDLNRTDFYEPGMEHQKEVPLPEESIDGAGLKGSEEGMEVLDEKESEEAVDNPVVPRAEEVSTEVSAEGQTADDDTEDQMADGETAEDIQWYLTLDPWSEEGTFTYVYDTQTTAALEEDIVFTFVMEQEETIDEEVLPEEKAVRAAIKVPTAGGAKLSNPSNGVLKVSWSKVSGADGYELAYAANKKFSGFKRHVTNLTSWTLENRVKDATFYVKVRAYKLDKNKKKVYGKYGPTRYLKITKGLKKVSPGSTVGKVKTQIISDTKVQVKASVGNNYVSSYDGYYYIFSVPSYHSKYTTATKYSYRIGKTPNFTCNLNLNQNTYKSKLQNKFVLAVKTSKTKYTVISDAAFITNPGKVADYNYRFPKAESKKGLQVNTDYLSDAKKLGVKHGTINVLMTNLFPKDYQKNEEYAIPYRYNDKTFWFMKGPIYGYDRNLEEMRKQDMIVSFILLFSWRDDLSYLISEDGRTPGYTYYNLDTSSQASREQWEALFTFLAERYASDGSVVNWILGNEVNSYRSWNWAGTTSLKENAKLYARSFRMLSTAVRSVYANARTYISLDHLWNTSITGSIASKTYLDKFAYYLEREGDINFNIAYHPYPSPLTDPRFWLNTNGQLNNSITSPVMNMGNLQVFTDYIEDSFGSDTRIIFSEQGFTSTRGILNVEKEQAAALAYAYYLTEFNDMVDSFILHRHIDHPVEVRQGLSLGLWTTSSSVGEKPDKKKYAYNVFRYMDTNKSLEYTEFALPIIGKKSWKSIVPGFDPSIFENM